MPPCTVAERSRRTESHRGIGDTADSGRETAGLEGPCQHAAKEQDALINPVSRASHIRAADEVFGECAG